MNVTEDFISIQGIFLNIEKTAGPLAKIRYKGGNEVTILNIITDMKKLLSSKNYIKDNKINTIFDTQLIDICMFLIFNTDLKKPLDEPGFEHLINIMPQLSTCVLANIIIGLDLNYQYCRALHRFDLETTEEFLVEMIPCIKKCKPRIHLKNAYECLKLIVEKISVSTEKEIDGADKLTDVASQMLLNLTGLHGEQIQNTKIDSVYECMGHTLLNLLDLLLMCNERNGLLARLLDKLLKTCCSVVAAVTIDVFCSWAEVEHNNQVLQIQIAEKSYMFIEKFHKHSLAKELISMLGTIAKKPLSVNELIHKADVSTMIMMVNKADDTQKQWFTALLNTQVLNCKESIKCVDRWAHLCTIGDVSRLLSMSTLIKDSRAMTLVIKCASTLDTEDLILATVRHFYQDGIYNNLNEDTQLQLVLLFNKIKDKNNTTEFCKDLYLLLLQNFEKTLSYIFAECLKNTFYTYNLESIWPHLAKIITIDEIGLKVLKREIDINVPNEDNCKNYSELFNELTKNHVYCVESMILNVLLPMLQKAYEEQNYELLKHGLQILMDMKENIDLKESTDCLFKFLFDLMKNCRCDFTNFDGLKQELVKRSADIVLKYCRLSSTFSCSDRTVNTEDIFVSFYVKQLSEGGKKSNALTHFFPVNFENHAETVAYMIKILPLCVTPEWVIISSALQFSCGTEKTMELLCDVIILLCELIKSQDTKTDEVARMLNALKYCLQNLGVTIKETLQPNVHSLQEDVCITRHMCRLLREIPAGKIKSEEGLSLASVLTEASLVSLRTDKKFVCLVSSINESRICKMLAQKILS